MEQENVANIRRICQYQMFPINQNHKTKAFSLGHFEICIFGGFPGISMPGTPFLKLADEVNRAAGPLAIP